MTYLHAMILMQLGRIEQIKKAKELAMEAWLSLPMKRSKHQDCLLTQVLIIIQKLSQMSLIITIKIIILHLKWLMYLPINIQHKCQAKYSKNHRTLTWITLIKMAIEMLLKDNYFLPLVIWMETMFNNKFFHLETLLKTLLLIKVLRAIQNTKMSIKSLLILET